MRGGRGTSSAAALLRSRAEGLGYPRSLGRSVTAQEMRGMRVWVDSIESNRQSRMQYDENSVHHIRHNAWSGEYVFGLRNTPVQHLTWNDFNQYYNELVALFGNILDYVEGAQLLTASNVWQVSIYDRPTNGRQSHGYTTQLMRVGNVANNRRLDAFTLLDAIEEILNSGEEIDLATTEVRVIYARQRGGGAYGKRTLDMEQWLSTKQCVYKITSREGRQDCFYQCLGIYLHSENKELKRVRRQHLRETFADNYRNEMKLHEVDEPVNLHDLGLVEVHYKINIHVINALNLKFIRQSTAKHDRNMFLLYEIYDEINGHYHLINEHHIGALWERRQFCYLCFEGYNDARHRCIQKCKRCRSKECEGRDVDVKTFSVYCDECHLFYYDEACYGYHSKVCKLQTCCVRCSEIYKRKKGHSCGMYQCEHCHTSFDRGAKHVCYMQKRTFERKEQPRLLFYDFECYMDENNDHKVYLIVSLFEGQRQNEAKVWHTVDDFVKYLLSGPENVTAIAHNGGRYDIHFMKKSLLNMGIKTKDIINGRTILSIYVKSHKLRFIDSFRFITVGLRKFPETFGLVGAGSKGYFPYRFLTKETLSYVGPMPEEKYFDFDRMKVDERTEALKWYDENKDKTFDCYTYCQLYCLQDVYLLMQGCLKFRMTFMQMGYEDPFQCITIAGVCLDIYRQHFMHDNTIALYDSDFRQMKYGSYFEKRVGLTGEKDVEIEGRLVHLRVNKELWIYAECVDNGCDSCYSRWTLHPYNHQHMHQLRYDLMKWKGTVEAQGYHVSIWWECEIKEPVTEFEGLHLRDAFYGGRVETVEMLEKRGPMYYDDVTSMYPYVLYGITLSGQRMAMPIGEGELILYPEDWTKYFGFIRCIVIAPSDLHLPVLPCRTANKLMFCLGKQEGTWTTEEVRLAVQMGYRVEQVKAVLHYKRKSSTLFRKYIQQFYRMKIIATGWKSIEESGTLSRQEFLAELKTRYGIIIEEKDIPATKNAGLYAVAKLCLNSLWGKFAQRDDYTDSIDVFDEKAFWKIVENDENEVQSVILHDNIARTVVFGRKKMYRKVVGFANLAIAAYTTAYARMTLYSILLKTGKNTLYMDTDSVIYRSLTGPLQRGMFLGELTDELHGETIVEFVSTGPKSYAYKTSADKIVVKVKGFTLNYETAMVLSLEAIRKLIQDGGTKQTSTMQFQIDPRHGIHTEYERPKLFKVTQNKRKLSEITEDYITTDPMTSSFE
jgi:hypothetical protein